MSEDRKAKRLERIQHRIQRLQTLNKQTSQAIDKLWKKNVRRMNRIIVLQDLETKLSSPDTSFITPGQIVGSSINQIIYMDGLYERLRQEAPTTPDRQPVVTYPPSVLPSYERLMQDILSVRDSQVLGSWDIETTDSYQETTRQPNPNGGEDLIIHRRRRRPRWRDDTDRY